MRNASKEKEEKFSILVSDQAKELIRLEILEGIFIDSDYLEAQIALQNELEDANAKIKNLGEQLDDAHDTTHMIHSLTESNLNLDQV